MSKPTNAFRVKTRIILLVTFLFCLPSLWAGMMGDDYMHYAVLNAKNLPIGKPDDLSLFGLFSFINGDPERNRQAMDLGVIPWWTYEELKFAFWRPVSEISHWIDHQLWPRMPGLMHLHNLLWYLGICALLAHLYRKTLGSSTVALLALALYALDSTHGFTLSWIANRNGLITAAFGLMSLLFYMRWREERLWWCEALSLVLMLLCLLSAELGISIYGYIGAYAITLDRGGKIKGSLATLPHLALIVGWWLFYKSAGFGAAHADGYYIDPATQPVSFLFSLLERLPVLLASQWGLIPAEVYGYFLQGSTAYILACVVLLVLLLLPVILVTVPNINLRFWLLGMLFSLLPAATALPHDRVLIFAGIGAAPALACFIHTVLSRKQSINFLPRPFATGVAMLLVLIHGIISPLLLPLMAYSTKIWSNQISQQPSHFPMLDTIEKDRLVLFGTPIASALAIAPFRFYRQEEIPEKIWIISTLDEAFAFKQIDTHTLQVQLDSGFIQLAEEALRDLEKYPFREQDTTRLNGLTVVISNLNAEGKPTRLTLTFDRPLVNSDLKFLRWNAATNNYEPITF